MRRHLAQFLGDRRVVELPRLLWWPILHGIILRTRPSASARKYASIWTDEGSPDGAYAQAGRVAEGASRQRRVRRRGRIRDALW
ncbi:MAG: ferrochelatase [Burkholderiaceae bacterium]